MKRRIEGRTTPLEELLEPFWRERPLISEHSTAEERAADKDWSARMYAVAAEHGYDKLEVIRAGVFRQMRPRPAPSMKRSKMGASKARSFQPPRGTVD